MKAVGKIGKLFAMLPLLSRNLAIVSTIILTVLVFLESVVRKFLNISIIVTTEVGGIGMLCLLTLGLGWIYQQKGHLRVTLAVDKLPARYLSILQFALGILSAVFVCYIMYLWGKMTLGTYESQRFLYAMHISVWPIQLTGLIGWFILLVAIVKETVILGKLNLKKAKRER